MVYPSVHFSPMLVRESRSMFGSCAESLATDRHVSWFAKGRSPFTHRTPLWSQTHRGLKTNIGSRAEKSLHQKGESGEEAVQESENGTDGLHDCLRCFKGHEVTNVRQELYPKQVGKRVAKPICPCCWRNRISLAPENHRRMRDGNWWGVPRS